MCLDITAPRGPKRRQVYKVLTRDHDDKLYTPYNRVEVDTSKPLVAEGELNPKPKYSIAGGAIHVFTDLRDAINEARYYTDCLDSHQREAIFVCSVREKDWVADGVFPRLVTSVNLKAAAYKQITFRYEIPIEEWWDKNLA